jgi:hypothetical protein
MSDFVKRNKVNKVPPSWRRIVVLWALELLLLVGGFSILMY